MKLIGLVVNKREFKWGSFLIISKLNNKFQAIIDSSIICDINDLIEIEYTEQLPDQPIKDNSIYPKELKVINLTILNKGGTNSSLLDTIRNNSNIFETKSKFIKEFEKYFNSFTRIVSPKIIKDASEGGSNLFSVNYFDETRFLAQSPQLYKQIYANALGKNVLEVSQVFRAENSNTSRHLNEFTSLDVEIILQEPKVEELVRNCVNFLVELLSPTSIAYYSFAELKELLKFEEDDLTSTVEKRLFTELNKELVVVTGYPNKTRAFYTYKKESFDVIYRGVEIVSGSVRKFNYNEYLDELISRSLNPDNFDEYLSIFKQGVYYHGGFAIGLERLVKQYLNLNNISQTTI